MTLKERVDIAIEKGITCDPIKGICYGVRGKEITCKMGGPGKDYRIITMEHNNVMLRLPCHYLIWFTYYNSMPVNIIDHINRDKLDNRIENLRDVTIQENGFNREPKGCYFNKRANKWRSYIKLNDICIHLGYYDTENEAKKSYLKAKRKYHRINDTKPN